MVPTACWAVIVPVKATARGKSRIAVDPAIRRRLATAMALDTLEAAVATAGVDRVVAVVENETDRHTVLSIGGVAALLTSTRELNEAIRDGVRTVADHHGPVVVLPADLPGVTPDQLAAALRECGRHPFSVVADRQGTGTTLLAAAGPELLRPAYGPGSFARHIAGGARPVQLPADSPLRRDIDTVADLTGTFGPRTTAAMAEVAASAGPAGDRS